MNRLLLIIAAACPALEAQGTNEVSKGLKPLIPVPTEQVEIVNDSFWSSKIKMWRNVTIAHCLDKFDEKGAFTNFDNVRDGKLDQKPNGPPWTDGLVYETIRGCAEFLRAKRDEALEQRLDGYIERIIAAQLTDPDGYLNTYTQMAEPTKRWGLNGGNDRVQHDVYNAGAMIEAGVSYYQATGKAGLLEAATKLANHMADLMGPAPKLNIIPGHSGPEEALVTLYDLFSQKPEVKAQMSFLVDEKRYLALAEYFIEGRGHYEGRTSFEAYGQDHKPVFQQDTIEGHAVRATLMGAGLAALARTNQKADYISSSKRLWENMVSRRMYITGGVGSEKKQEAFGPDYHLPTTGYMETCAAVGNGFYSRNMNLAFGESRYADELERVLYNGALGGVSLIGNTFAYVNPIEFQRGHARWSWSGCPCCPPMLLKLTGAMPGFIYAQDSGGNPHVNLFVSSRAKLQIAGHEVVISQQTNHPWDVRSKFFIEPPERTHFDLCIRVPGWCEGKTSDLDLYRLSGRPESGAFTVSVNGEPVKPLTVSNGYARISREWTKGDQVEIVMAMPVRRVTAPLVPAAEGRVALQRGPIVYALELLDLPCSVQDLYLPGDATLERKFQPDLFGGVMMIESELRYVKQPDRTERLRAIPYFAYLNRGPSDLAVWIRDRPDAPPTNPRP